MKFYVIFGVLAALALNALAEDTKESTPATTVATAIKSSSTHEGSDKWSLVPAGYGTALAVGSSLVVGVVVLLAIAAVVSPLFGYKLCQIFSTCDVPAGGAGFAGDAFTGYPSSPYATYQKRSIEYVKPILQVLNSAYEKYGHGESPMSMNMKKVNTQ